MPPPGQSVGVFESAAVPSALAPYSGLPLTPNFSRTRNDPAGAGPPAVVERQGVGS
jgi:hypothetical protein